MSLDVLIVDDSAAIRKILQRVLVQAQVPLGKVHEAADGIEALAKLKTEKVGLLVYPTSTCPTWTASNC